MKTKRLSIAAAFGVIVCSGAVSALDIPAAETVHKAALAAEAKALKAIQDYSRSATDVAEVPALQVRALEIEGRLEELNKKLSEALNAGPAWGANTGGTRKAQTELAALKKDGKADTPEAKVLATTLAGLAKEKARMQKAHTDSQIGVWDGRKIASRGDQARQHLHRPPRRRQRTRATHGPG